MTCPSLDILGRYFDGELDAALRADVEQHVAACARCAHEFDALRAIGAGVASGEFPTVPIELWPAIQEALESAAVGVHTALPAAHAIRRPRPAGRLGPRRFAAAAGIALLVGLGVLAGLWLGNGKPASAAPIDFSILLDAINADADAAFDGFLKRYRAQRIEASAAHAAAPALDFEVPANLPGGFTRGRVYHLRFGDADGIAAAYHRDDGEFMAAIFHPPVRREHFGTHQDYPCAIGHHRGHAVQVGAWRMVHLTDPSTCHCVLTREQSDGAIAGVMQAIAPRSTPESIPNP